MTQPKSTSTERAPTKSGKPHYGRTTNIPVEINIARLAVCPTCHAGVNRACTNANRPWIVLQTAHRERLKHAINTAAGKEGVKPNRIDKLESVLKSFINAVNSTGGVVASIRKGTYSDIAPMIDPEWIDLGDVYLEACAVLEVKPLIT